MKFEHGDRISASLEKRKHFNCDRFKSIEFGSLFDLKSSFVFVLVLLLFASFSGRLSKFCLLKLTCAIVIHPSSFLLSSPSCSSFFINIPSSDHPARKRKNNYVSNTSWFVSRRSPFFRSVSIKKRYSIEADQFLFELVIWTRFDNFNQCLSLFFSLLYQIKCASFQMSIPKHFQRFLCAYIKHWKSVDLFRSNHFTPVQNESLKARIVRLLSSQQPNYD